MAQTLLDSHHPEDGHPTVTQEPYRPCWQNLLFRAIGRSPIAHWGIYLLIFGGVLALNQVSAWVDRRTPLGTVDANLVNYWIWILWALAAIGYFLDYSRNSLDRFRPALETDDDEYAALQFRFLHLSWRSGWVITIVAAVVSVPLVASFFPSQGSGWSWVVTLPLTTFQLALVFFFFAFILRALRMIGGLYARVVHINIFHLEPLYALSGLSSRVGMLLVSTGVLAYLTNIVFTEKPQVGAFGFFFLIDMALAVLAFILPLGRIHRRLVEEKERINAENDHRLQQALRTLHRRSDETNWKDMGDFRHSIASLFDFRHEIKSISTWPWETATLRSFLSALLLPVVLWLIQQGLSRLLAR